MKAIIEALAVEHAIYTDGLLAEMSKAGWEIGNRNNGQIRSTGFLKRGNDELMITVEHNGGEGNYIRMHHKSDIVKLNSAVYPISKFKCSVLLEHLALGNGLPIESILYK